MEKIYKVQMNSKGAPDFSTAVEIPSSDNHDWERYSDKLWKLAYERGKEDEKRWWSGHCAKCTDEDIPQGWIPCSERLPSDDNDYLVVDGDGEMAVGYYRDDADAWDNCCFGWLEREDEDEHPTRLGKVVAWMPLPKPWEGADDYERAIEQMEHDMLYEPTYNPEDGSM